MENVILVAFLTGLTTGGLSCFAVQGGLLTGSIANQLEGTRPGKPRSKQPAALRPNLALPVLLFLLAKLVAYTLLGFALGALGNVLTLTPVMKGALQLFIGLFLVGNALRMLNVHPIFRYFTFEPPSALTRRIRRVSKGSDHLVTPLFLGALTVLIPCGVTQAMMAVAVGTGSPWLGAAILFAFVLGTSPAFFGVTVLAAGLGKTFQKVFYPAVGALMLALGLFTVNTGLNLVGSPVSATTVARLFQPAEVSAPVEAPASGDVTIRVANSGYTPAVVKAPAGQPLTLHLVTKGTYSCSRAFTIPALDVAELLPATGDTVVKLPSQPSGSRLQFTCSMGMYSGVIQFQ